MKQEVETRQAGERETYQAPEIVELGSALALTQGMGGTSKDMDNWTIPVVVPHEQPA
jgi:hypothetical protein